MRNALLAALVFLSLAAPYGCATPKPAGTPLELPGDLADEDLDTDERFRKYESVGLRPFDTSGADTMNVDADERSDTESFVRRASSYLEDGFMDEMSGNFYRRYGIVRDDEDAKGYDLVIEGRFVSFDRGSRSARYWGVGGWTSVRVQGTMTETATGKVVARFKDIKYGKSGSFGGDSIDLMRENCVEIGGNISDFLEEVY